MKFSYLFFIPAFFLCHKSPAQPCDSIVIQHILIQTGSFSWTNNGLYVDSFQNGKIKSHQEQNWYNYYNPNTWDYPWYRQTYAYDSLNRLTSYVESYIWNGTYYTENTKKNYSYDSLSRILTEDIYKSPDGAAWTYQSYQAIKEHLYNTAGKDSIVTVYSFSGNLLPDTRYEYYYSSDGKDSMDYSFTWNGSVFDTAYQRILSYDTNDSLIRAEVFRFDAGQWMPDGLDAIYYIPSGINLQVIDTGFYPNGNYYVWGNISSATYSPSGDLLVSDNDNSFDGYGYLSTYSYACNHLVSGFSGNSHGGSSQWYSSTNGYFTFDNSCRYATEWWHAEDNGTYNDNYTKYYRYADCDSMVLIAPSQLNVCKFDSIELDMQLFGGTPPYHFQWSPSAGLSSDTVLQPKASPSSGQSYTLTVTDSNGTTTVGYAGVIVDSVFTPNISISTIDTVSSCNSVILVADPGNYNHTWWYYEGLQIAAIYSSNSQVTVNRNGTYILKVTQNQGCPGYDTIVINFLPHSGPDATIQRGCNELYAISSTAVQYQWKLDNNNTGSNNDTLHVTSNGSYRVYVTDSSGCSNYSNYLYYRLYDLYVPNPNFTCHDSCNAHINASVSYGTPPYTYVWSSGETTASITNACFGSETLTVTDSMGCILTKTVSVGYYTFPNVTISASAVHDSSECSGVAFFTLSNTNYDGFNYQWDNGISGTTDSNLCAGLHSLTLVNGNFCTKTFTFNVDVDDSVPPCSAIFNIQNSAPPCDAECFGSLEVVNQVGTAPFSYQWISPYNLEYYHGSNPGSLCPGSYSCIMIDAAGCIDTLNANLLQPPPISATFNVLSTNQNDPCSTLVEVNIVNLGQFQYFWWCNGSNDTLNYLCPGNCQITIPITGSCTTYFAFEVPDSVVACTVFSDVQSPSVYAACDGQVILNPSGTPPYNIQWTTGETSDTLMNLCAGTYYYTVTDSVGCITTDSVSIMEPPPICQVTASQSGPFCHGDCNGILIAVPVLGQPPYNYLWSTGSTASIINGQCAGLYTLTMTDSVGCVTTTQITLLDPPVLQISTQAIGTTCAGCFDGQLISTATGGTLPYTFLVTPSGLTCQQCYSMAPGIYTVCVTDVNVCITCIADTIAEDPTCVADLLSNGTWKASVFPNPARENAVILIRNSNMTQKFFVELYDETGRMFKSGQLNADGKIDLTELSVGFYQIKISCSDASYCTGKLIHY